LVRSAVFSASGQEDRRGMAIIADDVFLDFAVEEKRPASFAANRGAPTFTRGGYLHPGHFYPSLQKGTWLSASSSKAMTLRKG
jgi:hypothetical protein